MNADCSTINELMIKQIADEKFNRAAKDIAPIMNAAVTEFANEIEHLLDPQREEEMIKVVKYIMANSIREAFGKAFDEILQEDENNA